MLEKTKLLGLQLGYRARSILKIHWEGLFVVNISVLLLTYVAVRLAPGAKVVSLGPCGQGAVVG